MFFLAPARLAAAGHFCYKPGKGRKQCGLQSLRDLD